MVTEAMTFRALEATVRREFTIGQLMVILSYADANCDQCILRNQGDFEEMVSSLKEVVEEFGSRKGKIAVVVEVELVGNYVRRRPQREVINILEGLVLNALDEKRFRGSDSVADIEDALAGQQAGLESAGVDAEVVQKVLSLARRSLAANLGSSDFLGSHHEAKRESRSFNIGEDSSISLSRIDGADEFDHSVFSIRDKTCLENLPKSVYLKRSELNRKSPERATEDDIEGSDNLSLTPSLGSGEDRALSRQSHDDKQTAASLNDEEIRVRTRSKGRFSLQPLTWAETERISDLVDGIFFAQKAEKTSQDESKNLEENRSPNNPGSTVMDLPCSSLTLPVLSMLPTPQTTRTSSTDAQDKPPCPPCPPNVSQRRRSNQKGPRRTLEAIPLSGLFLKKAAIEKSSD
jgi:hypothetical protein